MLKSCLAALALSLTAAPALAVEPPSGGKPIVIGQSYLVHSKVLGDDRRINVYLPESYAEPAKSFSVLFLLDGGEQEDFLHISGLAQINAAYGFGQELIVVGIEGKDRRHDLTSPSTVADDLKRAPTSGGSAAYRRFLVEELKPWVAAHFHANGRSGLIGESLAGLFTLETLLRAPESFDDYIAVSPSLWWNRGWLSHEALLDLSVINMSTANYSNKRIFIAFDEPAPPAEAAARERAEQNELESGFRNSQPKGLTFFIERPGETHGSIYHPAAMKAFRVLYAPPPAKTPG